MGIRLRFFGLLVLVFLAMFLDFRELELIWERPTGVCQEGFSSEKGFYCTEESIIFQRSTFIRFFDFPTIALIWGSTFFVVYTRSPKDSIQFWEEASHVAKDAGELMAALGSILVFTGVFNERTMANAFAAVFYAYFVGQLTALLCKTYSLHLKRKNDALQESME